MIADRNIQRILLCACVKLVVRAHVACLKLLNVHFHVIQSALLPSAIVHVGQSVLSILYEQFSIPPI